MKKIIFTSAMILTLVTKVVALKFISPHLLRDHQAEKVCPYDMHWSEILHYCTQCPPQSPISKNGKCFACPEDTHYQSYIQQCIRCPDNQKMNFDPEIKKCVCKDSKQFFTGYTCVRICEKGMFWDQDHNQCQACPKNAPLYKKQQCQACEQGTFFIKYKNSCLSCPKTMQYDQIKLQCVCIDEKNSEMRGQMCFCKNNLSWNQERLQCQPCPSNKPVSKQNMCYSCPKNTFYSKQINKCLACPDKMYFDIRLQACLCNDSSAIFNGTHCLICSTSQFYDSKTKMCTQCLIKTPERQYNQCQIQCPSHTQYDKEHSVCVSCPGYFLWNYSMKKCQCPYNIVKRNGSQICVNCPLNYEFDLVINKCLPCPRQKPILIDKQCVACPESSTFDKTRNICIKCPQNLVYSQKTGKCICTQNFPYFNGVQCQKKL